MQNNNSKINTVLLVILVLLAGFCAWKLIDNDKEIEDDMDFTPMDDLQTIDIEEKDEVKPVVTQPVSKTYSYPQTGPAFMTIDSKNSPTASYDANSNSLVFSGSLGTDTIMYTPNVMAGFYPCVDFNLPTVNASFDGTKYQVCSQNGNTYFFYDGIEGTGVLIKSSGANLSAPHYADPATLAFPMEGEN